MGGEDRKNNTIQTTITEFVPVSSDPTISNKLQEMKVFGSVAMALAIISLVCFTSATDTTSTGLAGPTTQAAKTTRAANFVELLYVPSQILTGSTSARVTVQYGTSSMPIHLRAVLLYREVHDDEENVMLVPAGKFKGRIKPSSTSLFEAEEGSYTAIVDVYLQINSTLLDAAVGLPGDWTVKVQTWHDDATLDSALEARSEAIELVLDPSFTTTPAPAPPPPLSSPSSQTSTAQSHLPMSVPRILHNDDDYEQTEAPTANKTKNSTTPTPTSSSLTAAATTTTSSLIMYTRATTEGYPEGTITMEKATERVNSYDYTHSSTGSKLEEGLASMNTSNKLVAVVCMMVMIACMVVGLLIWIRGENLRKVQKNDKPRPPLAWDNANETGGVMLTFPDGDDKAMRHSIQISSEDFRHSIQISDFGMLNDKILSFSGIVRNPDGTLSIRKVDAPTAPGGVPPSLEAVLGGEVCGIAADDGLEYLEDGSLASSKQTSSVDGKSSKIKSKKRGDGGGGGMGLGAMNTFFKSAFKTKRSAATTQSDNGASSVPGPITLSAAAGFPGRSMSGFGFGPTHVNDASIGTGSGIISPPPANSAETNRLAKAGRPFSPLDYNNGALQPNLGNVKITHFVDDDTLINASTYCDDEEETNFFDDNASGNGSTNGGMNAEININGMSAGVKSVIYEVASQQDHRSAVGDDDQEPLPPDPVLEVVELAKEVDPEVQRLLDEQERERKRIEEEQERERKIIEEEQERERKIIEAEQERQRKIIEAEQERQRKIIEAEEERQRKIVEAEEARLREIEQRLLDARLRAVHEMDTFSTDGISLDGCLVDAFDIIANNDLTDFYVKPKVEGEEEESEEESSDEEFDIREALNKCRGWKVDGEESMEETSDDDSLPPEPEVNKTNSPKKDWWGDEIKEAPVAWPTDLDHKGELARVEEVPGMFGRRAEVSEDAATN